VMDLTHAGEEEPEADGVAITADGKHRVEP
jgi:hypothetical protein